MFTQKAFEIFNQAISTYHIKDDVNQEMPSPYEKGSIEYLLFTKNWIDTVQWHYEDLIRDPKINPVKGMDLKRKIDASNQDRTNTVEYIDNYFFDLYKDVKIKDTATINSESPAWAIDRLSILELKIYHMDEEVKRLDATELHKKNCNIKLQILIDQRTDLSKAIDQLLEDIESGNKYMKVYKQMKMYNDEDTNPVLYKDK